MRNARLATVAVALAMLSMGLMAAEPAGNFVMLPYVTYVDKHTASVSWVVRAGAPRGYLALTGTNVIRAVAGNAYIPGREELVQTATLTGLAPGTAYSYIVKVGASAAYGALTSAPEEGVPMKFVIYGDTRSHPAMHRRVSEAIGGEKPLFVVHTGDLVTSGDDWDDWAVDYFGPARAYLGVCPVWPARGNHENSGTFFRALFRFRGAMCNRSFDYGNVHIVILDSEERFGGRAALVTWLDRDLAASKAAWTIVVYHEPTYNVGGHGSAWGRDDVLPVLMKHGVDMVVAGHSHLYERFVPIGPAGKKPTIFVVSGGGGARLYGARPSPLLVGGEGKAVLHYCVFEVEGNRLRMTVRTPDGEEIDRLDLSKNEGRYQDEIMKQAVTPEEADKILRSAPLEEDGENE